MTHGATRAWGRAVAVAAFMSWLPAAAQVPGVLGYQGRLLKADGTPERGIKPITFAMFPGQKGGAALWSETQNVLLDDEGYYATFLGSVTPLPAGLFNGSTRYLELKVEELALSPRQQVASVPYALLATNLSGGTVDATSIKVNGTEVFDSNGRLSSAAGYAAGNGIAIDSNTRTISLTKSCTSNGMVLSWNGTAWQCTTPSAVSETDPTVEAFAKAPLPGPACGAAAKLAWSGSAWSCQPIVIPDATTASKGVMRVGTGLSVSSGTVSVAFGTAGTTAASGNDPRLSDARTPAGAASGDLSGTHPGPTVAGLQGNPLAAVSPAAGQVLKWNGTQWVPQADNAGGGTVTAVTASAPLASSGGTAPNLSISDTTTTSKGVMQAGTGLSVAGGVVSVAYGSTANTCAAGNDGRFGDAVKLQGRDVAPAAPASGQVLAWSGSNWAPTAAGGSGGGGNLGRNIINWGSDVSKWTWDQTASKRTISLNTAAAEIREGDSSFTFSSTDISYSSVVAYYGPEYIPVDPNLVYEGRISVKPRDGSNIGVNFTGYFSAGFVPYNSAKAQLDGNGGAFAPTINSQKCSTFIADGIPASDFTCTGSPTTCSFKYYSARITGEGTGLNQFPLGTRYIRPCVGANVLGVGGTVVDAFEMFADPARGVPNGLATLDGSGKVPSAQMTQAGSGGDGWLSSADWNTFNNQ